MKNPFFKRKNNSFITEQEFLTIQQAADYLQISKTAVMFLVAKESIPYYEPVKNEIRLKKSDLNEWIERSRVGFRNYGVTLG